MLNQLCAEDLLCAKCTMRQNDARTNASCTGGGGEMGQTRKPEKYICVEKGPALVIIFSYLLSHHLEVVMIIYTAAEYWIKL